MFALNKANQSDIKLQNNEKIIDPLTISFAKSLFNEAVLNAKEVLRNFVEISLS